MQNGKISLLSTVSTRDFTGALAQNAVFELNLSVKEIGLPVEGRIRSIRVVSVDNLDWEIQYYRTDQFGHLTDCDADKFAGMHAFVAANAKQLGATGLWHYFIGGLDIPYDDADLSGELHIALVNRSAGAKAGAIRVETCLEQSLGC